LNRLYKFLLFVAVIVLNHHVYSQTIVAKYHLVSKDSLRVGTGIQDFMPYIQKGYTLMLPDEKPIQGVLIFLEDSGYDAKNGTSKQLYDLAVTSGFAVLSVSSEIPFDFYFSTTSSMNSTHEIITQVFKEYTIPNTNIFLLGPSLIGHRAVRYIKFVKEHNFDFQLQIKGLVLCNFTMDFTRKWYQHQRDIRINKIDLWEPKFINYMLETNLMGTPESHPENYHEFSSYSYFDAKNRNIPLFVDYAVRAYIDPAIAYRLKKYHRTLYENNSTDMVGFLAELELAGNQKTQLMVLPAYEKLSDGKDSPKTWDRIDKQELMHWIVQQTEN